MWGPRQEDVLPQQTLTVKLLCKVSGVHHFPLQPVLTPIHFSSAYRAKPRCLQGQLSQAVKQTKSKKAMAGFSTQSAVAAAAQGVLRVLVTVSIGSLMHYAGLLPPAVRAGFSRTVVLLALPLLFFTSLARGITQDSMGLMGALFGYALLCAILGGIVGAATHQLFVAVTPSSAHPAAFGWRMASLVTMLRNTGVLPIALATPLMILQPFGTHRDVQTDIAFVAGAASM